MPEWETSSVDAETEPEGASLGLSTIVPASSAGMPPYPGVHLGISTPCIRIKITLHEAQHDMPHTVINPALGSIDEARGPLHDRQYLQMLCHSRSQAGLSCRQLQQHR